MEKEEIEDHRVLIDNINNTLKIKEMQLVMN